MVAGLSCLDASSLGTTQRGLAESRSVMLDKQGGKRERGRSKPGAC